MDSDYSYEVCPFTNVHLTSDATRDLYHDLLPMHETRTEEVDRISCEEEERSSTGFDIRTYFRLSGRMDDLTSLHLSSDGELLLKVQYLPAATLVQISHKWRSSKEAGFLLETGKGARRGIWFKRDQPACPSLYNRYCRCALHPADQGPWPIHRRSTHSSVRPETRN